MGISALFVGDGDMPGLLSVLTTDAHCVGQAGRLLTVVKGICNRLDSFEPTGQLDGSFESVPESDDIAAAVLLIYRVNTLILRGERRPR